MTKDEMLAYLREAVRSGRIDGSVYQRVREYVTDVEPIRTCHIVPFDDESMRLPHCSVCGQPILKPWPKFCPRCGARVVSGDGDE